MRRWNQVVWTSPWRAAWCLALGVLLAGVIGCQADDDSAEAPPSLWWYFEDARGQDEMAFRTAMLMSLEGWNGANSQASSIAMFSDLYDNGGLLLQISMTGRALRPRCSMLDARLLFVCKTAWWRLGSSTSRAHGRFTSILGRDQSVVAP